MWGVLSDLNIFERGFSSLTWVWFGILLFSKLIPQLLIAFQGRSRVRNNCESVVSIVLINS